jgi:hypothetical protein
MRNRILITVGVALAAALTIPSLAAAHTGSVKCDGSNIVFSYNANFAHDTTVTEFVKDSTSGNGTFKTFLVHAYTTATDTVPSPSSSVTASATWKDGTQSGSIAPVTLTCTQASTPVTACYPSEVVTQTVYTPGPETIKYVPFETTTYVDRWHTKIRFKTKWRTKVVIRLVPFKPVKQPNGNRGLLHATAGVAG